MQTTKSRLDGAGRLVIPALYRQALHLSPGEEVLIRLHEGEIRVTSFKDAAARARDIIAQYNKDDSNLLEMLFKLRREDSSDE